MLGIHRQLVHELYWTPSKPYLESRFSRRIRNGRYDAREANHLAQQFHRQTHSGASQTRDEPTDWDNESGQLLEGDSVSTDKEGYVKRSGVLHGGLRSL